MTFEAVRGGTLMRFTQTGFDSEWARDGHGGGWSESFERLAAYLAERLEPAPARAMVGSREEPTMRVNIYLSFDGRCAEAFDFYADVLGGTVEPKHTWGETPHGGRGAGRAARQDHARGAAGRRPADPRRRRAARMAHASPQGFSVSVGVDDARRGRGASSTRWPRAGR